MLALLLACAVERSSNTQGTLTPSFVCARAFRCPEQGFFLTRIEREAGIKFEKRGAPQPEEIMEASAMRAADNLDTVNEELEPYFLPTAEKLIEEHGSAGACPPCSAARCC